MYVEGLVPSPGEAALLCTGCETLAPLWWAGWWETGQPQSLKQGERGSSQSRCVRRSEDSFTGTTQRPDYNRSLNITLFVFPLMINLINPSTSALLSQLVYQGATDLSKLSTAKSTCSTRLPEAMLKTTSWVKWLQATHNTQCSHYKYSRYRNRDLLSNKPLGKIIKLSVLLLVLGIFVLIIDNLLLHWSCLTNECVLFFNFLIW